MKLNKKRTIFIGFAFMSICMFWQFYDNEIPKILKNTFNMGETMTGVIMALDNVLALFLLPFFGSLSDRTETKHGKRMPYILLGTAIAVVSMFLLINVANQPGRLPLFVGLLLVLLVAMGIYRSPAVSLMPDLTPPPLRSSANAIINLMGAVGGLYTLAMIKFLLKSPEAGQLQDHLPLTIAIALGMVVSVLILFFSTSEPKISEQVKAEIAEYEKETGETLQDEEAVAKDIVEEDDEKSSGKLFKKKHKVTLPPDVKRSMGFLLASVFLWFTAYNAVITAFSRYVEIVWDMHDGGYATCLMIGTIAGVISFVPIAKLSGKIGRKKTILTGIICISICFAVAGFFTKFHPAANFLFALMGFGWAAINVNSYPMVVEMSGASDIGRFTGLYYTFSMAAQVFTPIFSGFLLEHVSYKTLFPYAVIFAIASFVTMTQVKHGDTKPLKEEVSVEEVD